MRNKNIGSCFDDFMTESATLDEASAVAVKRVIAWQIEQEMKAQLQDHAGERGGVREEVEGGAGGVVK